MPPSSPAAEPYCQRLRWQDLDPAHIATLLQLARDEDLHGLGLRRPPKKGGDVSAALLSDQSTTATAALVSRKEMVACGLGLLPLIVECYGFRLSVEIACEDGQSIEPGTVLGYLCGRADEIVQLERVALNFLQMLSGVATETARYVRALGDSRTRLLDTRKTLPGYRMLQKYAVACGGGWNHRLGLFDRVMLKDNHLAAGNASTGDALFQAVRRAVELYPQLPVEVEVDHLEQICPAIDAGAHIILLDNFDNAALQQAVSLIAGRAHSEASGGITRERLPSMAQLGLDYISTGATVHQAHWQDIGLDWQ